MWVLFCSFFKFPTHTKQRKKEKEKKKKTSCCDSKFAMKHMLERDWKSDLPLFIYDDQNHMFVDFLIGYIGPPNSMIGENRQLVTNELVDFEN